jgi:hypothetical protein
LDSTTVLVTSGEAYAGIRWGYIRDTTFVQDLSPLTPDATTDAPSLRPRATGGFRCAWDASSDKPDYTDIIEMRSFRDGVWSGPETLQVHKPFDAQQLFYEAELSAEGSDVPALAWYGYSPTVSDAAYYIWTSFPTDAGPGLGERFEGSWSGINPTLVRDEDGDVWLAWWRTFDGVYWAHTYATAVPSAPSLAERDHRPLVRWSLDRRAPETWWAVLRAEGDGPLVPVTRLRASSDTIMSWADASAPTGVVLRYAVRRECRDVRYRVTSADARWEPRSAALTLALMGRVPVDNMIEMVIIGAAAGLLEVTLYDVQGRRVADKRVEVAGSGRDQISLPLDGALKSGLYLLRAKGGDGRLSPSHKVVVVR